MAVSVILRKVSPSLPASRALTALGRNGPAVHCDSSAKLQL